MKKPIPIDALLTWAYQELLKQPEGDATWASMFSSEAWQLGARVDQSSLDFVPDCLRGMPHPDAVAVHEAVKLVGCAQINWETDAEPLLGPLAAYLDWDEVRNRCTSVESRLASNRSAKVTGALKLVDRHLVSVGGLLMSCAISRSVPVWHLGEPQIVPLRWPNGKPRLANGEDRPTMLGPVDLVKGKSRPVYYATVEPSAIEIAEARFEFHVWLRALRELAGVLDLVEWKPEEPVYPLYPWLQDQRLWVVSKTKYDKYVNAM